MNDVRHPLCAVGTERVNLPEQHNNKGHDDWRRLIGYQAPLIRN